MTRFAFVLLCLALGPATTAPLLAQTQRSQPDIAALADLLDITGLIEVMRDEGRDNAIGVDTDLLNGQGGAAWLVAVDKVYDPAKLRRDFDAALGKKLDGAPDVQAAMADFFGSDLGKRVVALEVEARRALMDDSAEAAAKSVWGGESDQKTARAAQIERFVQANDLIESNVMGALNSNLAFFQGLSRGGAFENPMPEDEMLSQVWAQEGDIRAETADWLYPFLMLAYQPLSDADLEKYIAFSDSAAGKKINAAIFAAFDAVFVQISKDLGQSAAMLMQGEDI